MSDGIEGILLGAHVINDNSEIVENNNAPVNYPGAWSPHKAYALRKHGFFVPPATGKPVSKPRHLVNVETKYVIFWSFFFVNVETKYVVRTNSKRDR